MNGTWARWARSEWLLPAAAGVGVTVGTVLGGLLPFTGVMASPPGFDPFNVVGVVGYVLWGAVAVVAAARPATRRFALLVVISSFTDFVWALGYFGNDALYFLSENFKSVDAIVLAQLIVTFPTGRLRDRFDQAVVVGLWTYFLVGSTISLVLWEPGFVCEPGALCPRNPFLLVEANGLRDQIATASGLLVPVIALSVVIAVVRHWREATPVGRRILRPLLIATPIVYLVHSSSYVMEAIGRPDLGQLANDPILYWNTWLLPAAFLIGVVRAVLARSTVGDLAVELAEGLPVGGLRDALARALRDPSLQLAYPAPEGEGFVDSDGRPIELPKPGEQRAMMRVERNDELLAVLIHDPAVDAQDPGLVERVAAMARLALENERLSAQVRAQLEEVRASRARIVEAADAERRRVERDLHDGAQQRLVALAMRLELARTEAEGASQLIDQTTSELKAAIAEVRGLARGLHPPILTERGLAAALESLAERSAVPVRIDAPDGRYPSSVETAAYFVVAEALTNVAKYAHATSATVTVRPTDDGGLRVSVTDDGRGGADPAHGSGLSGLADRLAALGGRLTVESPPGGGTTVTAVLPA
jgi:signal transduction histidine kinase